MTKHFHLFSLTNWCVLCYGGLSEGLVIISGIAQVTYTPQFGQVGPFFWTSKTTDADCMMVEFPLEMMNMVIMFGNDDDDDDDDENVYTIFW